MKHLPNGSKRLKAAFTSSKTDAPDPLDRAKERLDRADKATELLEYSDDWEEATGRTDVTVNLTQPTPPQPSSSEITVAQPAPGVTNVAVTVARLMPKWGLVLVLSLAIIGYVVLRLAGLKILP